MRLARVLALPLALTVSLTSLASAQAANPALRRGAARAADGSRPGPGYPDHPRPPVVIVVPQTVVVTAARCWQPGSWSYQWVPQSYSYTAWMPGQWSPDGAWVEGRYEPAWYSTGYYQPLWVEGYWSGC